MGHDAAAPMPEVSKEREAGKGAETSIGSSM
jgi:hypothetical protein